MVKVIPFCVLLSTVAALKLPPAPPNDAYPHGFNQTTSDAIAKELLSNTTETLKTWNMPSVAEIGERYGRFRLSKDMTAKVEELEKSKFGARHVCAGHGRGDIFFYSIGPTNDEGYDFHISTPWTLTYHKKLYRKIERAGFIMLGQDGKDYCAMWDPIFSVNAARVQRGMISMNWPEENLAPLDNVQSWVVQDWDALLHILLETYPGLEIFLAVLGSLLGGALLGCIGWYSYKLLAKRYGWGVRRSVDYWAWRKKNMQAELKQNPQTEGQS